jgi:hypothetical protein
MRSSSFILHASLISFSSCLLFHSSCLHIFDLYGLSRVLCTILRLFLRSSQTSRNLGANKVQITSHLHDKLLTTLISPFKHAQ